jgi:hypothetical protein
MNRRTAAAALGAMAAMSIGATVDYVTAGAAPDQRSSAAGTSSAARTSGAASTTTSTRSESRTTVRDGVARCSVRIVTTTNGRREVRTDRDRGAECSARAELNATTTESRSGRP